MLILTLIVSFGISVLGGPIYESPEAITEVCVGGKKRLNWKYSNVSELDYAIWTKETTQIAYISGTSTAVFDPLFQDKFDYISDGTLELQDAVLSDAGKYKFNVVYKGSSGLPVDDTSTDLNVLDPPAVPTGNCTGSGSSRQCTCTASSLGTPAADVKIKVDSKLQASEEATVDLTQTADCCVIGDAAKCITENTTGSTEYCVNIVGEQPVPEPECCLPVMCYIGVFVSIPLTIVIVSLYFYQGWEFIEIIHRDFIVKAVLPATGSMVVGLGLVIGLCVGLCIDCDENLRFGLGPGIPLVIFLNPCCSVGIILFHWKILDGHKGKVKRRQGSDAELEYKSGDKTDSAGNVVHKNQGTSCFGRNNTILPICSGQDKGRQHGSGHEHTKQKKLRSLPVGGESGQPHDGPKNNTTTFHRKLPEIPRSDDKELSRNDNKNRGLSDNFDELSPEKKRLAPLGQESVEPFVESPKKKKKKKKSEANKVANDTD